MIVRFAPRHLLDIDPPVLNADDLPYLESQYQDLGPAYTATENGKAIGCWGMTVEGDTGRVWAFLSDEIREHPMTLHRQVLRHLRKAERDFQLRRVEGRAHVQFESAKRWFEALGFRAEGMIGAEYIRFARCPA